MGRGKYWPTETPHEVITGRNRLRLFREARRLQVCGPDWQDAEGQTRQGKTVALDLLALEEAEDLDEVVALFREILAGLESAAEVRS